MMTTKRKILVPIDFNERSIDMALSYAAKWAQRFSMDIDILHVIEESGFFTKIFSGDKDEELRAQIRQKLEEIAKATENEYQIRVNPMVTQGRIAPKINETAKMLNPDIIIMSSGNSYNDEEEPSIGANTHRIVRITDFPVLIVRHPNFPEKLKNILVPIDLSTNSRIKIPDVANIAKKANAIVTLIYGAWGDNPEALEGKLNIYVNQSMEYLQANGVECKIQRVPHGKSSRDYVKEIVEYSENNDMDIIIVVGRAESVTDRYMDYMAQDLLRLAPIPVLCIAPKPTGINVAGRI